MRLWGVVHHLTMVNVPAVIVDLSSDYFDLFGLPRGFSLSDSQLIDRFRELQRQLHPDKFAAAPDAERRWSMQAASHVNEGYQTLSNDLRRASYLLQLNGISLDEETDTQMSPMFLMEQMELREALEAASDATDPDLALDKLRQSLKLKVAEQSEEFAQSVDQENWSTARTVTRQWQFLDKLQREVKAIEERLDV